MIRLFLYNDRFWTVVLVLLFLLVDSTEPIQSLERAAYDWGMKTATRPMDERITLITIDDTSIARLGAWPWPKQLHARLLEILTRSEPKAIAFTFPFLPSPVNPGVTLLTKIKSYLETLPAEETTKPNGPDRTILNRLLEEGFQTLNEEAMLSEAIQKNGHVILTMPMLLQPGTTKPSQTPAPSFLAKSALPPLTSIEPNAQPIQTQSATLPLEELGKKAAGIGVELLSPDTDNRLRSLPLLVNFQETLYPSLALAVAIHVNKSSKEPLQLHPDGTLQLGKISVKTQSHWQLRPYFHAEDAKSPLFTTHPFHAILDGNVPLKQFRDQIILVGMTANTLSNTLSTPVAQRMTTLEIHAQTLTALLHQDHFRIPDWAPFARWSAFFVITFLLILIGPKQGRLILSAVTMSLVAGLLLFLHLRLLAGYSLWVPLIGPLTLLISGYLLLALKQWLVLQPNGPIANQASIENNRMLGLALQGQKQWDLAWEKFALCPMDPIMMGIYDHLAQDLETALQFSQAIRVYQRMSAYDPHYPALEHRLQQAMKMANQEDDDPDFDDDPPITLKTLREERQPQIGSYLIIQELATDPQGTLSEGQHTLTDQRVVVRTLNPKTANFTASAREQLAREADILSAFRHPGIVAVHAVGSQEPLPYVIMEPFWPDHSMEQYTKPDTLLPLPTLLHAITQVAMTLHKIHQSGITHGNLRPEELIHLPQEQQVKIKEFGIARFLGTHPGGTGISPYAAPEAIANQLEDQRTDLYAVGAILWHLLTGHPPFKADDPETLRHLILTTPPPAPDTQNPYIPKGLTEILEKALHKQPNDRYQTGADMARDLVKFIKSQVKKKDGQETSS